MKSVRQQFFALTNADNRQHDQLSEYSATTFVHADTNVHHWRNRRLVRANDIRIVTLRRQWRKSSSGVTPQIVLLVHKFLLKDGLVVTSPVATYDLALGRGMYDHRAFMRIDDHAALMRASILLGQAIQHSAESAELYSYPVMPEPMLCYPRTMVPELRESAMLQADALASLEGVPPVLSREIVSRRYATLEAFRTVNGADLADELLHRTWADAQAQTGDQVFVPRRYLPSDLADAGLWFDMEKVLHAAVPNPTLTVLGKRKATRDDLLNSLQADDQAWLAQLFSDMRAELDHVRNDVTDDDLANAVAQPDAPLYCTHRARIYVCMSGYPAPENYQWNLPGMSLDLFAALDDDAFFTPVSRDAASRIRQEYRRRRPQPARGNHLNIPVDAGVPDEGSANELVPTVDAGVSDSGSGDQVSA